MADPKTYQLMELKHFHLERRVIDSSGTHDFVVSMVNDPQSWDVGRIHLVGSQWEFVSWVGVCLNSSQLHELWEIVHLLNVWPDAFNPVPERVR